MDIRRDIIADFKQWKDEIIPIEVKAENRFSFLNLQSNGGLLSCPSPLAEWFWKWI